MRAPGWATASSATSSAAACCSIWSMRRATCRQSLQDRARASLRPTAHGLADKPEIVALVEDRRGRCQDAEGASGTPEARRQDAEPLLSVGGDGRRGSTEALRAADRGHGRDARPNKTQAAAEHAAVMAPADAAASLSFRRIIVKVGSSLLVDQRAGRLRRDWLAALAERSRRAACAAAPKCSSSPPARSRSAAACSACRAAR